MYVLFKVIHLLAVVAFVGNIAVGVFWKAVADRTNDPRIFAHTLRGIIVIVLAGVGTAMVGGFPILGTGWILWSIVLFGIAGIEFATECYRTPLHFGAQLRSSARPWPSS